MKLTKCNINEIEHTYYKKSDNLALLEEFLNSNMDCAEVEGFTQKSASTCAASFNTSIKNYRFHGIKAISRRNKVYLVKTEAINK